jgi:hypothetical protein
MGSPDQIVRMRIEKLGWAEHSSPASSSWKPIGRSASNAYAQAS